MATTSWEVRLRALTAFVAAEGREPSGRAASPGEHRLALWLEEQRKSVRAGRLGAGRVLALQEAGLLHAREQRDSSHSGAVWLKVESIADFLEEEGRLPSLTSPQSAGEKRLAAWLHSQLAGRPNPELAAALRHLVQVAEAAEAARAADAAAKAARRATPLAHSR
ncbi:helicase associated domain-containing protein [Arthrobacter sp. MDT2-2]